MAILIFVSIALIVVALVAIVNVLVIRRLQSQSIAGSHQPKVSVLIPARNEAGVIERTVHALLAQDYPDFELLVLDDYSDDGTAALVQKAAGDRVQVLTGQPLPDGWVGKNWACHQLARVAQGDVLVFTDADVYWEPGALSALIGEMQSTSADLVSVWPTQQTVSWGERLVVPLMGFAIVGYLPLPLVHHSPWSAFAAANGQCMAFRRTAYELIGGHQAVKAEIVEDVALAQRIKRAGMHLWLVDGAGLIHCRMYSSWRTVRDGFAKNILAGHGDSVAFLALSSVFHWLLFVMPWIWLIVGWMPLWAVSSIVLGLCVRLLSGVATGQRLMDGLLMPLSVLLMTRIALQAMWWQWCYGGPRWKGRTINQPTIAHG